MIIDTHSHLHFDAFKNNRNEVINRALAENIWTINVGTNFLTSQSGSQMVEEYNQGVFASVGLHPLHASADFIKIKKDKNEGNFKIENNFEKEKYKKILKNKKIVAIGEIGLDYYYKPKTTFKLTQFKEHQKKVFIDQLNFAKESNLPVILHCRMAHQDLIEILSEKIKNQNPSKKGVIHCFTGTVQEMEQYINLGFLIGINGIIFRLPLNQVVKNCPLKNMVVETDCPYLTPPQEKGKINEPLFIKYTIQKIAELKNISFNQVCQKTTENARELFSI